MTVSYLNSDLNKKMALLRVAESSLNSIGKKMYKDNWNQQICGVEPSRFGVNNDCSCGDKYKNSPNCVVDYR